MSSDNNEAGESSKKVSPDIMKKLNDAFSSYLDGDQSANSNADQFEKDSLLELVQSGIIEKQDSNSFSDSKGEDSGINDAEFVETEKEPDYFPQNDEPLNLDVNIIVPDTLSGVFDDVVYQSVEIEIDEIGNTVEHEGDFRYSEIVSDILKKTPKAPVLSSSESVDKKDSLSVDLSALKKNIPSKESESGHENVNASDSSIEVEPVTVVKNVPISAKAESKAALSKSNSSGTLTSAQKISLNESLMKKEVKKIEKPLKLQKVPDDQLSSINPGIKEMKVLGVKESSTSESPVNIAFLYSKDHIHHDAASLSINTHEKPERLIKAMWYLEKNKVFSDGTCTLIDEFGMAEETDLLRVHDESYISFVRSYASAGGGFLGDSTYMTPSSYEIAKAAAGAAITAGDLLVDKKFSHAFVMARPPGHHASSQKYGGFCLFNNAAILARHLQSNRNIGKVLILDWDAHAGDGTMEIFYDDPTVMFLSLHRDPHGFYPRKGFSTQIGENAGKGYTMNVEMPEGAGNDEYMLAFDEVVIPMVNRFAPDYIIVSCGFDAYYKEKNIGLTLDSEGYHQMTSKMRSVFHGPMVFLMEGGYHDFNGQLCHSVLSSLHEKPNPVSDSLQISSYKLNQKKQIFADTQKKIEESKKHNPILSLQVS
ncbi:histone deacetylase [Methanolobus mangrovi]|uniref:Histone deacetylase n=1 Tax=Methanolobus mangrovi TaxID=3072977 RepID=A0AA51UJC3_9EURY|nr:histone deacetylase [Methanolobus mangrovi]WMW23167.1 histone deacetylase [Methanolobus mangrovi]